MNNDLRKKMEMLFEQYEVEPPIESWEEIKSSLQQNQKKRFLFFFWYSFIFLALTAFFNRDVASHYNCIPRLDRQSKEPVAIDWYKLDHCLNKRKKYSFLGDYKSPCITVQSYCAVKDLNLDLAREGKVNKIDTKRSLGVENYQARVENNELRHDVDTLSLLRPKLGLAQDNSIIELLRPVKKFDTSSFLLEDSSSVSQFFEPITSLIEDTSRLSWNGVGAISLQNALLADLDRVEPLLLEFPPSFLDLDFPHHKTPPAKGLFLLTTELLSTYHLMKAQIAGDRVANQLLSLPSFDQNRISWGLSLNYKQALGPKAKTFFRVSLAAKKLAVHYDYKVLAINQTNLSVGANAQPRYTPVVVDHVIQQDQWTLLGGGAELGFKLNQISPRFDLFSGIELNYILPHKSLGIWPSVSLEYAVNSKIVLGTKLKWQTTPLFTPDDLVQSKLYALGLLVSVKMD